MSPNKYVVDHTHKVKVALELYYIYIYETQTSSTSPGTSRTVCGVRSFKNFKASFSLDNMPLHAI